MTTVLLVEDDPDLREVTTYALQRDGYRVIAATDGLQALQRWEADAPDLVLLDIGLPRLDGFEVCRRIRAQSRTPVILLTAQAAEEQVLHGFRQGADDYVTKPFSHKQLAMRIRAVLSRAEGGPPRESAPQVRTGGMTLDTQMHTLTLASESAPQHLTPIQFRLLELLVPNEGHVVTSARLIEHAWGYDGGDTSVLKTYISQLRRKLGQQATIRSLPTVGYVLHATLQQDTAPGELHAA